MKKGKNLVYLKGEVHIRDTVAGKFVPFVKSNIAEAVQNAPWEIRDALENKTKREVRFAYIAIKQGGNDNS